MNGDKLDVKSLPMEALAALVAELGMPRFHAKQIYAWLHKKNAVSFAEMTDLSTSLRDVLSEKCYINSLKIKKKLVSDMDSTVKYLYELWDGNQIESVFMRHRHGTSLCISTQAGCRMGCRFCASAVGGLARNLSASEMLDQVYQTGRDCNCRVDGVVLMGIGEPLDNFDNVVDFLGILSSPEGLNLSLRHVSLSTCGLADKIDRLAELKLQLTLSVSLHAADDKTRSALMPVNRSWPLTELLTSCRRYFLSTGRRISFEYALISGENDSPAHALALAELLRGMGCHVNLIPLNPVNEHGFLRGDRESVRRFQTVLEENGVRATVRRELGADIAAACGQLRHAAACEGGRQLLP